MVKLIVLWKTPQDPVAFERHFCEVHIPLVRQLPGLRGYAIGRHATALFGGEPYYGIDELEWETMEAFQKAFQSQEGQATAQDAAHLARSTGVLSMVYEVQAV